MKEIAEQRVAELVARYPQLAGLRAEVAEAAGTGCWCAATAAVRRMRCISWAS
ncbi:MAG: hypothetical protein II145_06900 [Selenomonas sp.]|nr:hypothetical protein [Selenomonas sp.]